MVKLDPELLRFMSKDEFRLLTAIEMGMKNHEFVPVPLITRISGLKKSGAHKALGLLHKNKLVFHQSKNYDGFRLTYAGYDYLALKTLANRGLITGVGRRIGVGKESDIYEVYSAQGESLVLKIHRLGRVSFRAIKSKRDYLAHRSHASWMYMARLASVREFAYMKALYDHGFPTPVPIDHNRHVVLMSRVNGVPFSQVRELKHPMAVYTALMNLIVKLAEHGLIHCDFNEFNLMIGENERLTMIDFPQMVSTSHTHAKEWFDRDVQCVRTYFSKRLKFECADYPKFEEEKSRKVDLDIQLGASGVSKHEAAEFEQMMEAQRAQAKGSDDEDFEEGDDDEDEDEEEEEEKHRAAADNDDEEEDDDEEEEEEAEESSIFRWEQLVEITPVSLDALAPGLLTVAAAAEAKEEKKKAKQRVQVEEEEEEEEEEDTDDEEDDEEEEDTRPRRQAKKKGVAPADPSQPAGHELSVIRQRVKAKQQKLGRSRGPRVKNNSAKSRDKRKLKEEIRNRGEVRW